MTALRRRIAAAVVAACALACTPAMATTYYYCYLDNPYATEGYVYTPILKTPLDSIDESATGYQFHEYASSKVSNAGSIHYSCSSTSNADAIRRYHAEHVETYGGIEVEWPDPPVPSEPMEDAAPTGSLVIEEAESLVVPPEELAARALAEERRRAAALAKFVAENARRDAVLDAQLQESIRRAKRRGRMQ